MGIMDFFRRKDDEIVQYARAVAAHESQRNRGSDELEKELNLGIKENIIHDKGAESIYDSELWNYARQTDEQGNSVIKPIGPDYSGQARRLLLSPKLGLGNIDKKNAELITLYAKRELINMEMSSEEYEYHQGIHSRYIAQYVHAMMSIAGSIDGKQQRNLLITPHVTRVEAGEISKKKEGSII